MAEAPVILVVGGLDPSAGAGLLVDADAARDHGALALPVAAAVTAQSSAKFHRWRAVDGPLLKDQLDAVLDDYAPDAVKIGMLGSTGNVAVVADVLERLVRRKVPVVLDPVLLSSTGGALSREGVTRVLAARLLPRAAVATPNAAEAAALTGVKALGRDGMAVAAVRLVEELGAQAAVVTGGDVAEAERPGRRGQPSAGRVRDAYFDSHEGLQWIDGVRVPPPSRARTVRGTGCRFATAVAAGLARKLAPLLAVREARRYVRRTLETRAVRIGRGAAQVIPPRERRSR